jgi:Protein of unknown function (DUF3592)
MKPGMKFLFGRVLPWPLVLAGAALLSLGIRDFNRGRESVAWPTVEGHVVGSWMAEVRHKSYLTGVLYDYRLSGVTCSSDRILFEDYGLGDSGFSHAKATMDRYPREISVQVHYHPQSPELSVLETGVHGQIYEVLVMGLLLFCFGCSLLWRRSKRCRQIPGPTPDNDGLS